MACKGLCRINFHSTVWERRREDVHWSASVRLISLRLILPLQTYLYFLIEVLKAHPPAHPHSFRCRLLVYPSFLLCSQRRWGTMAAFTFRHSGVAWGRHGGSASGCSSLSFQNLNRWIVSIASRTLIELTTVQFDFICFDSIQRNLTG